MAEFAYTDAFLYCAGYDFTVNTNSIQATMDAAALDATTFNSGGWTELAGGLKTSTLNYSGFWDAASSGDQAPDNQAFPMLLTSQPYTFGPVETENERCWIAQGMKSQYAMGGTVGELMPFSLATSGTDGAGMVRGRLAKSKGTVSAAGPFGTVVNLGAVAASQYLYATFHVFTAGTTMTVLINSDDNAGLTSPTTRATVGTYTASTGTWMTRIAGPITDTHYTFHAVSGITGSFTVAGAIGIQ